MLSHGISKVVEEVPHVIYDSVKLGSARIWHGSTGTESGMDSAELNLHLGLSRNICTEYSDFTAVAKNVGPRGEHKASDRCQGRARSGVANETTALRRL